VAWYWGRLKPYGFYFRHIDGVTLRNVTATVPGANGRPMIEADADNDVLNANY
jgi:hypothetical protein